MHKSADKIDKIFGKVVVFSARPFRHSPFPRGGFPYRGHLAHRKYVRTNVPTPNKCYKKLIYTRINRFFYQFIWYFHFFVVILRANLNKCAHKIT